jgi:hypothetical protein
MQIGCAVKTAVYLRRAKSRSMQICMQYRSACVFNVHMFVFFLFLPWETAVYLRITTPSWLHAYLHADLHAFSMCRFDVRSNVSFLSTLRKWAVKFPL